MINFTLYKRGLRESVKTFAIFGGIISMYYVIIVAMFDPELSALLDTFTQTMPDLMAAFGMSAAAATLTGFIASYLYGFIMIVVPMVYSILAVNRLVARHTDKGSMAYLLSVPFKRRTVILTQLAVLFSGILALVTLATIIGLIASAAMFPGDLETGKFLLMNAGVLGLQLFIGALCFFGACVFSDAKKSMAFGAGISAVSFIIQMMSSAADGLKNLKYATFFTLFSPDNIIEGKMSATVTIIILYVCAAALCAAAVMIFSKRNLSI